MAQPPSMTPLATAGAVVERLTSLERHLGVSKTNSSTGWFKVTKLYPQTLEVTNNLWQGNVNLNSSSQKGHQQNCQCLFNLMVLVRGFDRRVFWILVRPKWETIFRAILKERFNLNYYFSTGWRNQQLQKDIVNERDPCEKLACHSLDPAKNQTNGSSYILINNSIPSFLNFDRLGRWLGCPLWTYKG